MLTFQRFFFPSFFFICCYLSSIAQKQELFYFLSADSLVGVKNSSGDIIIPAEHLAYFLAEEDFSQPITDNIIILLSKTPRQNAEPHSFGLAYNRIGEICYAPYLYDNGPDYYEEGLSRFVENGKIGFVDRTGKKVIPAQWDWASYFEYGIARVCNNCYFDYSKDAEHPSLDLSKAQVYYIDKQGKPISPLKNKQNNKDQFLDSLYFPYEFKYSTTERRLLTKINAFGNRISRAYFVNYDNSLAPEEKLLHFELVERPSKNFPYAIIQAFRYNKDGSYHKADLQFYADATEDLYNVPYHDGTEKIPLDTWLASYEADARRFSKEHPDAPNRFQ